MLGGLYPASNYPAEGWALLTSGSTTNQDLTATQTQTAQIQYSYVQLTPASGGSFTRKSEPANATYERRMNFHAHQTATLDIQLEPSGLPLVEDDELAILLLI